MLRMGQIVLAAACLLMGAAGWSGAGTNAVAVIYGEESVVAGDRAFAQALARHAVRWYREAGLDVATGGDSQLAGLLAGAHVAVLIEMMTPTAGQLARLRSFVQGGGRLIVCYSTSPQLAELMDVAPVGYAKGDTSGHWSCMHFEPGRPAGVPESILQSSPNLFLVKPVPGASQVLAWWDDRAGRRMPEPAWLSSRHGFWMTHVLLADGDSDGKAQLLLALSAACDPSLWLVAAERKLAAARQTGPFHGAASVAPLVRKVRDPARRAIVQATAKTAVEAEAEAVRALREGRGFAAWEQAVRLQRQLDLAYGWMQAPRAGEMRAIWDHSGMGLYPGDWGHTCQVLKDNGFTDIFVCVGGAGFSNYRSGVLPPSRIYLEQGDQLAACLAAAKPRGLRVQAWLFCFCTEQATEDRLAVFRNKGWLLSGEDGRERHWLDPAVKDVRGLLVQASRELATRYAVDGVHLDFVRYPDLPGSLGPTVRQRYEAATGKHFPAWPAEVHSGGAERTAFLRWRCDQVTDLVAEIRTTLRREAPGKLLTAAVYGKYPSCADAVGQDWESWLRQGYVDYLMPMDYTEDPVKFRELLDSQTRASWLRKRMLPGLGVTAAESRLGASQVVDEIQAVREAGCPGFALFDLNTHVERDILPVLKVGVMAQ